MNALAIAVVNVRRLLRDRSGLFFVFVLPVILIVVLGTMYGGRVAPRMGIVATGSGPLGTELVDAIRNGGVKLELREPATEDALRAGVEDGRLEIAVIIPAGYDATLRGGGVAHVVVLGQPEGAVSALRQAVDAAIAEQAAAVGAARLAVSRTGIPFDEALARARTVRAGLAGVTVAVERIGEGIFPAGTGAFAPGAQSQVILFMFLTSMTAATQLILTRQLGVSRRMVASPVRMATSCSARRSAGSAWPWSRGSSSSRSRPLPSASAGAIRWPRRSSSSRSPSSPPARRCWSASSRTTPTRPARWA